MSPASGRTRRRLCARGAAWARRRPSWHGDGGRDAEAKLKQPLPLRRAGVACVGLDEPMAQLRRATWDWSPPIVARRRRQRRRDRAQTAAAAARDVACVGPDAPTALRARRRMGRVTAHRGTVTEAATPRPAQAAAAAAARASPASGWLNRRRSQTAPHGTRHRPSWHGDGGNRAQAVSAAAARRRRQRHCAAPVPPMAPRGAAWVASPPIVARQCSAQWQPASHPPPAG
jgi:hypothetical protein